MSDAQIVPPKDTHALDPLSGRKLNVRILSFVTFTFITYFSIGVTLAVLPTFVHAKLGVSAFIAGLMISLQYIATFISRPQAGALTDTIGPKTTVRFGLMAGALSGLFLLIGALTTDHIWLSLTFLVLSRLAMGTGESFCSTGSTMWAIGSVGSKNTAQVISFNGVATYGALAIGAPVGVIIDKSSGLSFVGFLIFATGLIGYFASSRFAATATIPGERYSVGKILRKVSPYGFSLALGGLGFGMIATFVTLYFYHMKWDGAALTLSIFGACFVGTRLVFANAINRFGGFRVTMVSLIIEAIGLVLLAYSTDPFLAHLAAALIGFGFALVFPALAVEMVKVFPPSMHGSAIGIYNAFTDLSLFLTGPVAGLIIEHYGYRTNFLLTAIGVFGSFILVGYLQQASTRHS